MTYSLVSQRLAEHAACVYSLYPDTTQLALCVCVLAQQGETKQLAGKIYILKHSYFGAKHSLAWHVMAVRNTSSRACRKVYKYRIEIDVKRQ